jgi:glycosyltransferase involved in cell wall biosynthesis
VPPQTTATPDRAGRRVVILVENESVPHDRRVLDEARALVAHGYEVCVICPADSGELFEETMEGFRVLRYRSSPARSGALNQIREYANALVQTQKLIGRASRNGGFDVILACNPPDLFFLTALPYKLVGKKFIFDQHDLAPELYQSIYGKSTGPLMWALRFSQSMSYRLADSVITVNESYASLARNSGQVPADRVFVVRNGPREGWPLQVPSDDSLKRGHPYLVLYLGVMGYQDGLDVLLQIAEHLVKNLGFGEALFALVGDGDAVPDLKTMAQELGIEQNVEFVGWVSDEELISRYLQTADACVCPEPSSPLNDKSTFVKVMEYMASGKPIVAFDLPETRVSAGDSAVYASPGDVPAFARVLMNVLSDPGQQQLMQAQAEARLPALRWENQVPALLEAFSKALG